MQSQIYVKNLRSVHEAVKGKPELFRMLKIPQAADTTKRSRSKKESTCATRKADQVCGNPHGTSSDDKYETTDLVFALLGFSLALVWYFLAIFLSFHFRKHVFTLSILEVLSIFYF